jgi:hypothetical protein
VQIPKLRPLADWLKMTPMHRLTALLFSGCGCALAQRFRLNFAPQNPVG